MSEFVNVILEKDGSHTSIYISSEERRRYCLEQAIRLTSGSTDATHIVGDAVELEKYLLGR